MTLPRLLSEPVNLMVACGSAHREPIAGWVARGPQGTDGDGPSARRLAAPTRAGGGLAAPCAPRRRTWCRGAPGQMGATSQRLKASQRDHRLAMNTPTTAADTRAALEVASRDVELLLFAGGDGTLRDIWEAVERTVQCSASPVGSRCIPARLPRVRNAQAKSPGHIRRPRHGTRLRTRRSSTSCRPTKAMVRARAVFASTAKSWFRRRAGVVGPKT